MDKRIEINFPFNVLIETLIDGDSSSSTFIHRHIYIRCPYLHRYMYIVCSGEKHRGLS